jgi:predicted RecB family endonuclease
MKTNDGKRLEELARIIEGRLSPIEFKVESRKPVFNDKGVQVAEFDIVISGGLGTSK